ncbi:hypothetical protein RSAG8_07812, partial [Rhizoctonia solani AG-8 WAC10335]
MSTPFADGSHPLWGRKYPEYTVSYTDEALTVPLSPTKEPRLRMKAFETIDEICKLECFRRVSLEETVAKSITLSMLTALLEMTNFPGHFRWMAEPRLISGCVGLMTSMALVLSNPFQYEYGYVCFRILALAVNACLLEHAGCLGGVMERMDTAPAFQRFSVFWEASARLIDQAHQGNERLASIIHRYMFDKLMLDQLLQLLNGDRKLFLVVSKMTGSLGISGVLYVLFRHLVATEYVSV